MIAMRPILEQDVIDLLNNGRFEGDLDGYVVMEGPTYLGYILYRLDKTIVSVLDCGVENTACIDGAIRACLAAGENAGCTAFEINGEDEKLKKWRNIFCKNEPDPVPINKIFSLCK
ncbi:hypothetical protein [uncultured Ruthenibacterium sp.]|uniref:hypothetical protein n=1 Tax=uncultured Ruthenibacterium sp. TaxID=1905347 RepID=UPI00349E9C46